MLYPSDAHFASRCEFSLKISLNSRLCCEFRGMGIVHQRVAGKHLSRVFSHVALEPVPYRTARARFAAEILPCPFGVARSAIRHWLVQTARISTWLSISSYKLILICFFHVCKCGLRNRARQQFGESCKMKLVVILIRLSERQTFPFLWIAFAFPGYITVL